MKDGVIADFEITEAMLRYFIQQGAQPHDAGAAAHRHLPCRSGITEVEKRAVREIGRVGRRARGLPDRGADGGGDRRRPAGHRAVRQHDRRHRRRHDRGRGHLAGRHRLLELGARRRRQDGRGDRQLHQAQVQPADRRAHRRADQDRRSAPPIRRTTRSARWRSRAATWWPACRRRSSCRPRRSARRCRSRSTPIVESVQDRPRAHAAGARRRHRRQGHRAGGRRRAAAQPRRAAARGDRACR